VRTVGDTDTLLKYRFKDAFTLVRVIFTKGTYSATVSEADINLS